MAALASRWALTRALPKGGRADDLHRHSPGSPHRYALWPTADRQSKTLDRSSSASPSPFLPANGCWAARRGPNRFGSTIGMSASLLTPISQVQRRASGYVLAALLLCTVLTATWASDWFVKNSDYKERVAIGVGLLSVATGLFGRIECAAQPLLRVRADFHVVLARCSSESNERPGLDRSLCSVHLARSRDDRILRRPSGGPALVRSTTRFAPLHALARRSSSPCRPALGPVRDLVDPRSRQLPHGHLAPRQPPVQLQRRLVRLERPNCRSPIMATPSYWGEWPPLSSLDRRAPPRQHRPTRWLTRPLRPRRSRVKATPVKLQELVLDNGVKIVICRVKVRSVFSAPWNAHGAQGTGPDA
jgi:hypothetical protein